MRNKYPVLNFFYLAFAGLLICGCAGNSGTTGQDNVPAQTSDKPSVARSAGLIVRKDAAFAWHPNVLTASPGKAASVVGVEKQVQQAITEALTEKGYSFVSATESWPDYFVGYVYLAGAPLDDDMVSKQFDLMPALRPNPDVTKSYAQGSLVIDIIEPTAFRVLWRASTPALLVDGVSNSRQPERIRQKVNDLLSQFPEG